MSLKKLISFTESKNIAKDLTETELAKISRFVIDNADRDKQSMAEWSKCVEKGIELTRPEFDGKSEPFENSANFKSNILSDAINKFGNKVCVDLMRDKALAKAFIVGEQTIRNVINAGNESVSKMRHELESIQQDKQQLADAGEDTSEIDSQIKMIGDAITQKSKLIEEKKKALSLRTDRADRVSEFINWQINSNMDGWIADQKRLMYRIPAMGTVFKKTFYDECLGTCVSQTISHPDFYVSQHCTSIDSCTSFTHVMPMSKSTYAMRVAQGSWLEHNLFTDGDDGTKGTDEHADAKTTENNDNKIYEQHTWLDLDKDGIDEPYIVTVHVRTGHVLRIVARFDIDDIHVKFKDMKIMPFLEAQRKRAGKVLADNKEFGTTDKIPDALDTTGYNVVRVDAEKMLTKYGLIPSFDGTFLDVGFYHIIGSLTLAHNKTTNDLINSGTLATLQGGFTALGFRKKPGIVKVKMGEFVPTEVPAGDLAGSIMPMPFKEPSQVLFALNEKIEGSARGFYDGADLSGQLQSDTAPTTALAMIHESGIEHTAHIGMIIDSMSNEFSIIYELNGQYSDDDTYRKVCGDDDAVFADDFADYGMIVGCGADPQVSSKIQRMMLANAEMSQVNLVIQAGGNPVSIIKNYYERIGCTNIDEIFPNSAELSPEAKQQMDAMKAQQEQANAMAETQTKLLDAQTQILLKGEERKNAEFELSKRETIAKMDETLANVEKLNAETLLKVEQAITEKVKNGLAVTDALSNEMDKVHAIASSSLEIAGGINE